MPQPDSWIVLNGRGSSLVLEVVPGEAPLWRYWGPRLPDGVTPPGPLRAGRPTPSFSPEFDQPLSLVPGLGQGWFGEPGLKAHRAGRDWTFQATACAVERDGQRVTVTLTDAVAKIAVAVSLTLDPDSDVLTVSSTLTSGPLGRPSTTRISGVRSRKSTRSTSSAALQVSANIRGSRADRYFMRDALE